MGLGYRFAKGGHDVILGSRTEQRAIEAATQLDKRAISGSVRGMGHAEAAEAADLVLLAVPFNGHDELVAELATQLAGKVVISCVNPLGFDKQGPTGWTSARPLRPRTRRSWCRKPTSSAPSTTGLLSL